MPQAVWSLSVSASRIVASKLGTRPGVAGAGRTFQYPRVGSLPRNDARADRKQLNDPSFSIRESDRCLETRSKRSATSANRTFSIRESDRCLETTWRTDGELLAPELSVSASRIVASKPVCYGDESPLQHTLSVSASRIVASKLEVFGAWPEGTEAFSIRESDRCLETTYNTRRQKMKYKLSVSASRIVASKLHLNSDTVRLRWPFSIRESDRCLETAAQGECRPSQGHFQYPRVGSLPRNKTPVTVPDSDRPTFSIRESDRCLETWNAPNERVASAVVFQYPRVGSLPRNAGVTTDLAAVATLSVSASRIVASKLRPKVTVNQTGRPFQYPRVGSLPRNDCRRYCRRYCHRSFSIRESDRCLETCAPG